MNFSTPDTHVVGSCDIYTTKAAGGDKKLYKNIENSLESQHESLVRLSASLSPPYRTASDDGKGSEKDGERSKRGRSLGIPEVDLSRASPFGPLSQIGARRTFAYLIATLNASHPDYDFSLALRPRDFRKERSLRSVMHNIDSTLQNLRPRLSGFAANAHLAPPPSLFLNSAPAISGELWNNRMWNLIDEEMGLRQCEKYSYVPDRDPFDGEECSIWSMHYFFFNKEKKRVCYFYLRALSVISHSPVNAPSSNLNKRRLKPFARKASSVSIGEGAGKRASYWLGGQDGIDTDSYGDDDDDEMIIEEPNDDEVEVPYMDLDDIRRDLVDGYLSYDMDYEDAEYSAQTNEVWKPDRVVRGVSEEIGDVIEL